MARFPMSQVLRRSLSPYPRVWRLGYKHAFSKKPGDPVAETPERIRSRIERLTSRLPKFLQHYVKPLINAPVIHITAFLVLHEVTAIVPLVGLAATFYYTSWTPSYISGGKWANEGIQKFGNYLRKKGWLGEEGASKKQKWWARAGSGVMLTTALGTAYAITKLLLPIRLLISVSCAPWFAKTAIIPFMNLFRRVWRKRS